jgi:hypothetical protein
MSFEFNEDDIDIRTCPVCRKDVPRENMDFTRDCHGITYRLVCQKCWDKLMRKGYDGEYYDDRDECLDDEY